MLRADSVSSARAACRQHRHRRASRRRVCCRGVSNEAQQLRDGVAPRQRRLLAPASQRRRNAALWPELPRLVHPSRGFPHPLSLRCVLWHKLPKPALLISLFLYLHGKYINYALNARKGLGFSKENVPARYSFCLCVDGSGSVAGSHRQVRVVGGRASGPVSLARRATHQAHGQVSVDRLARRQLQLAGRRERDAVCMAWGARRSASSRHGAAPTPGAAPAQLGAGAMLLGSGLEQVFLSRQQREG